MTRTRRNGAERGPTLFADGRLELDRPAPAVARLTIRNAAKRNALDQDLLDALATAVHGLAGDDTTRCLIISGSGGSFSAGYDIGNIPQDTFPEAAERLVAHPFSEAMEAVGRFPFPTVAAINGHAFGGGLELAIQCDLRIASAGAKFSMPPGKLGLVYGHTGIAKFIETVGAPRTREMFFLGRVYDSAEALAIGLVGRVVEPQAVAGRALALAEEIASNSPFSLKGNKRIINALAATVDIDPALERELTELRLACFATDDFREGISAFAEKRPPSWRGR